MPLQAYDLSPLEALLDTYYPGNDNRYCSRGTYEVTDNNRHLCRLAEPKATRLTSIIVCGLVVQAQHFGTIHGPPYVREPRSLPRLGYSQDRRKGLSPHLLPLAEMLLGGVHAAEVVGGLEEDVTSADGGDWAVAGLG